MAGGSRRGTCGATPRELSWGVLTPVQRLRQAEPSWLRSGQTTTLFSSDTEKDPVSEARGGIPSCIYPRRGRCEVGRAAESSSSGRGARGKLQWRAWSSAAASWELEKLEAGSLIAMLWVKDWAGGRKASSDSCRALGLLFAGNPRSFVRRGNLLPKRSGGQGSSSSTPAQLERRPQEQTTTCTPVDPSSSPPTLAMEPVPQSTRAHIEAVAERAATMRPPCVPAALRGRTLQSTQQGSSSFVQTLMRHYTHCPSNAAVIADGLAVYGRISNCVQSAPARGQRRPYTQLRP